MKLGSSADCGAGSALAEGAGAADASELSREEFDSCRRDLLSALASLSEAMLSEEFLSAEFLAEEFRSDEFLADEFFPESLSESSSSSLASLSDE